MFITSVLEHNMDDKELTYYFMAQSGGKYNTRMADLVGVPMTSNDGGGSHEFSGIIDLSGMLARKGVKHQRNLKKGKKAEGKKLAKKTGKKKINKDETNTMDGDFVIKAHDGEAKRAA